MQRLFASWRTSQAAGLGTLLVAGVLLAWWSVAQADRTMRETLLRQTRLAAEAVHAGRIRALEGSRADLANPDYQRLKDQLATIGHASDKCRFVYLLGRRPDGDVFIFVDNEPPDSRDYSPPGQPYEEASEECRRSFDRGTEVTAGPLVDRWGTWISAFVPIRDPQSGGLLAVLGMDVDARTWSWDLAYAGLPAALLTAALMTIWLVGTTLVARRGELQRLVLGQTAELQESEDRVNQLAEHSRTIAWEVDVDGLFTYISPVVERVLGYRPEEVVGRMYFYDLHPEAGREAFKAAAFETFARKEPFTDMENLAQTKDGRSLWLATNGIPLVDADGTLRGYRGSDSDITDRKRAEEALRESEERYRMLVENANDIIYSLTPEGIFQYVSPNWTSLLGHDAQEVAGHPFAPFVHPDDVSGCLEFMWKVYETGEPRAGVEYRVRHKDGHWCWHTSNAAVIRDAAGRIVSAIGIARDITERKRMDESLKQANEELHRTVVAVESANKALEEANHLAEAATRAKSEFLANMSHEIRTPMTAILGYAEVLLGDPDIGEASPERVEAIRTIQRNGRYLLGLINDILDLSKIEAGKLQVERVACSPAQVLDEVITLMRVRADAKRLPLTLQYVGGIPESIRSDPLRLRQVLVNLVSNAVKFTETGSVRVVARLVQPPGRPALLQVDVIDTGIGLTGEQAANLFKPFSQADTSTTRKYGGTGLGLTISKRLAEMLGGDISVQTEAGKGSTFCLTIEAGDLEGLRLLENPAKPAPVAAPTPVAGVAPAVRLDGRILLVEDGPDNQRLIAFVLRKAGAEVTVAENGQIGCDEAMAAYRRGEPFDVILMDMQMPVMDGYEATRRLRAEGYTGPIVALTAHAMAGDDARCCAAGCDGYLTKPIDQTTFLSDIAQRLHPSPAPLETPSPGATGVPPVPLVLGL